MKLKFSYPLLVPLWVAVYVDVLGYSILIPFLPFFAQDFHATPLVVGLLLSVNAIFSLVFGPIWGRLSDRHGRKPFLLCSIAGTMVGFFMLAFSTSLEMLFVSRAIDGIFGGVFPITKAIIGDIVPPKDRSEQMSNIGVMHIFASLFGPGIGGALSRFGIIAPGLLAAGLCAVAFALSAVYLRETAPCKTGSESLVQKPVILHQKPSPGETPPSSSLWRNKSARWLLFQWGFHTLTFATFIASISLFGSVVLALNAEQMGYLLMIAGALRVFVRFIIFTPLLNKVGDRKTALIGLGAFVVSFIGLAFVFEPVLFIIALIGTSFAASCTRGPLSGFISRAVDKREQGKVQGYANSVESVSNVTGPILGGFILGALSAGWFGGVLAGIGIIAFLMGFPHLDLMQDQEAPTRKINEAEIG